MLLQISSAAQQQVVASEMLNAIRERTLNNLHALPNYTCTSTIERSSRRGVSHRYENIDRIRVEIAYLGGRELFGWPEGERIAEEDLRQLVDGTITNGDFALLTRALFAGPGVSFKNIERKDNEGRQAISGGFIASREGSEWVLAMGQREEPVGYYGSFLADPESLRLRSIAMTAEFIPREFGYRRILRTLEFQTVRIGSDEFLLPARAELLTLDRNGQETRNETSFANCRKYSAESVIRFELTESQPANEKSREMTVGLPDIFVASCELESPVDSDSAAVGDPITARLTRSIPLDNGAEIEKGATLLGRIDRLNVVEGRRYADFRFRSIEWRGNRIDIAHRINHVTVATQHITGQQSSGAGAWSPKSPTVETITTSVIRAYGRHLVLPRGFQFRLESKTSGH